MKNQNVVPPGNEIAFRLEREEHSNTCYDMDELEDILLKEISPTQKDKHCMIPRPVPEAPRGVRLMD